MKIILQGYMGSGKTGVGELLSAKLGVAFLDLDREIERREDRKISEIFAASGEIFFRKKEMEVLQHILDSEQEDFVLALGGGTPCYGNNMKLLKDSSGVILVYLKTSLEELTERLNKEKASRPLVSHLENSELLKDFIRKHLFERAYYYNQSDVIVETDSKLLEEVVQEIQEKLDQFYNRFTGG